MHLFPKWLLLMRHVRKVNVNPMLSEKRSKPLKFGENFLPSASCILWHRLIITWFTDEYIYIYIGKHHSMHNMTVYWNSFLWLLFPKLNTLNINGKCKFSMMKKEVRRNSIIWSWKRKSITYFEVSRGNFIQMSIFREFIFFL